MASPILKMMTSPDLYDMEEGAEPANPESFAILVQCQIGLDGPAADTFDIVVLSPDQVVDQLSESGLLVGRGYLFMRRYDLRLLREEVLKWCRLAEAEDWEISAEILNRYMLWEFGSR